MYGIGPVELIILAIIGLVIVGGGVAMLVIISLALGKSKKRNQD